VGKCEDQDAGHYYDARKSGEPPGLGFEKIEKLA
jgi:hypothetical protein